VVILSVIFFTLLQLMDAFRVGNCFCEVPNASFEKGDEMPQEWSLSGYTGEWEGPGHSGRKCISVEGDGQYSNFWKCEGMVLEPDKIYRVSFWARSENASGGCAISGPAMVNRDYLPDANWRQYGYVFRMPSEIIDSAFRFGQWCVKGKIFFDDIVLNEVLPIHLRRKDIELGEGEKIQNNTYFASPRFSAEGSNYSRCLYGHTAFFNTNRWCLGEGAYVIYRHNAGNILQKNATLKININYYTAGKCLVEVSNDGRNFEEIGDCGKPGLKEFIIPEKFFPATEIYVRLSGTGSGCYFQINEYSYEAGLAGETEDFAGSTQFVELITQDKNLKVEIHSFGSGEYGRDAVNFSLTNTSGKEMNLLARLEVAGREFSKPLRIKKGETIEVEIPYEIQFKEPGEFPVMLSITEGNPGRILYCSRSTIKISYLNLRNYGYRIKDGLDKSDPCNKLGLWWCEGTYKISRNRPLPEKVCSTISISAAKNEYEPFQLVLRPEKDLETVTVQISNLERKEGGKISKENITIDLVGYVDVQIPTDEMGIPGPWPDPLPHYKGAFSVRADRNQPIWFTVYVPPDAIAGDYTGVATLNADREIARVPVNLHVWNFTLPEETHLRSGFGFNPENVRRYHNLKSSRELREVCRLYYQNFAAHRVCPYTPMRMPRVKFLRDTETKKVIDLNVDFTDFDTDCEYFLNELGFNAFRLLIEGMGWGTFHERHPGVFAGYRQGTVEYEALWGKYLKIIQDHLEEKGWLKRAYIYWFDEPEPKDYPFVIEGMKNINKFAPKLARMLTEEPQPELYGNVDLWCPVLHNYDSKRAHERQKAGDEVWWYICCSPHAPYIGLFIDHPAIDLRIWSWMSWQYNVQGLLIWETTWWTSPAAFPKKPQNPWLDPMSYQAGYGLQEGQVGYWGNGDGRFFYPPNQDPVNDKTKYLEGPVNSIRWEMLREGIEDYEYFWLLHDKIEKLKASGAEKKIYEEAGKLLNVPKEIFSDLTNYAKNPEMLYRHREKVARKLEELLNMQ